MHSNELQLNNFILTLGRKKTVYLYDGGGAKKFIIMAAASG